MKTSTDSMPNLNRFGNTSEETTNSTIPNTISRLPNSGPPIFIDSPSFSSHSGHNSLREKLKQTFSFESRTVSIPGDLHRSQQRSSFSFLLGRIYRYYSLIALKCVKVGNVNIRMVVLLGK